MSVEIRCNEDGSLNEIVAKAEQVQLEQMDKDHWFLSVGDAKVWLTSDTEITALYLYEGVPEDEL